MELNAEQIKKALEYCNNNVFCDECPIGVSKCHILEDALALISSQEQMIKELTEDLHATRTELTQKCASLNEENERLRNSSVNYCNIPEIKEKERADTVRKMQERLKEAFKHYPQRCGECCKEKVDQISKEMLEDKPCT